MFLTETKTVTHLSDAELITSLSRVNEMQLQTCIKSGNQTTNTVMSTLTSIIPSLFRAQIINVNSLTATIYI